MTHARYKVALIATHNRWREYVTLHSLLNWEKIAKNDFELICVKTPILSEIRTGKVQTMLCPFNCIMLRILGHYVFTDISRTRIVPSRPQ